jgi:hypothetical protein
MAKARGFFFLVAGTASLCVAHVMHSSTATDHRISSKQSDIVSGPGSTTDSVLPVASEGMPVYLRHAVSSVEPTEDQAAPVVVTIPIRNNAPSPNTSTIAARSDTPMPGDRALLVRELQRELRRVGCYDGALNESWTLATRTAMKAFTNRINASLPIDKPDQVLLALVQSYRERVCGVVCPPGEDLAKDGRCLSHVILARMATKAPQNSATSPTAGRPRDLVTSVWSTVTPAQPEIRDLANRQLALAEPSAENANATRVSTTAAGKAARARASRPPGNFARAFFRLFGW